MSLARAELEKAIVLHRRNQQEQAEACYRAVLRIEPQNLQARHGLGVLCLQQGRLEDAHMLLSRAAKIRPDSAAVHHDHGLALRALSRNAEAIESFDRALALKPQHASAWFHRGNALQELNRAEEAIASYDRAIALQPDFAAAFNNRGNAFRQMNRLEEALASYGCALALQPNQPLTWCNRGFACQDLGRLDEALASYDTAIALEPGLHEAHRLRGTLLLLKGDLREGFAEFEHRLESEDVSAHPQLAAMSPWRGESLSGRSILVYSDGAFGDLVQFCRYLPMLVAQGARAALLAPAKFHRVLATEWLGVRSVSTVEEAGAVDFRCELMSLPFLLKTDTATIPPPAGHLAREPERIAHWRGKLPKATFNIGICWQGNPARHIDRGRSVPLAEFAPLAQIPGVRLVSLQNHHGLDQLNSLPPGMQIEALENLDNGPDAFVDTAAMMQSLDLIVSSDTAVAHLAAALGRPTWIALRQVPEWRWFLERSDSPWYPAVRLFRQQAQDQWRPVFERMAKELRAVLASKGTSAGDGGR